MKTYQLIGEIADFDYHDDIWDFCSAKSVKSFLSTLSAGEKAVIEINSPGGLVIQGVEIANAIKNSKAHLVAHITGMAASMASVVACACDEIQMEEASMMMIHDPWATMSGSAAELRKEAKTLDQMKEMIMSFYASKFNKTPEEIASLMSETTYLTGNECAEICRDFTLVKSDVRFAAKMTRTQLAKAPEGALQFFKHSDMDEETKAKLEAVRAEQLAAEKDAEEESFKARYQGASKKINEYQAKIVELEKSLAASEEASAALQSKLDEAIAKLTAQDESAAKIEEFQGKISELESALAERDASVSKLKSELDEAESNLAAKCEQVEQLEKAKALLTGGGLFNPAEEGSYAAKMNAAKTPEEREELRAQKKAGKFN